MKVEYINPFILSTCKVFSTMLDLDLSRGVLQTKSDVYPPHEISGLIELSGQAAGMAVVSLSRHLALRATGVMLGDQPEQITEDVIDVVGELANMIVGGAKTQLEELALSVGLPSVICGRNHIVSFPSDSTPIMIPFDSLWGSMTLEVGFADSVAS